MKLLKIAKGSLLNRKATAFLTILSIALSVTLLLGIERVRSGARKSFESTVSGVDLIVGARSGPVSLLLYSVFRIGNATNNISYQSFNELKKNELVDWTIPISLGDSHRGHRVVGTNSNYFKYYKYAGDRKLAFDKGRKFEKLFDVVIGKDVAERLRYKVGDKITLSHGSGDVSFQEHADKPFIISGILEKTGTPVDKSVHVSLKAITALHIDWLDGGPPRVGEEILSTKLNSMKLEPAEVTAFFVKLKSNLSVFKIQREINNYENEALLAILPGVTLRSLWGTIGLAESALFVVSILVYIVSLMGLIISLLATLNERRREMAILRSIGAKKRFIFLVLITETFLLTLIGVLIGVIILYVGLLTFSPLLESKMGITLGLFTPTGNDYFFISSIFLGSLLSSLIPAWMAYRNSLADGLIVKN
ncbi:MAG: ABC transporter permease [Bdellovibrionaceae bacterium]|nr:ABC transporter permease [Pseudobdellovibrionaceae bacterium]